MEAATTNGSRKRRLLLVAGVGVYRLALIFLVSLLSLISSVRVLIPTQESMEQRLDEVSTKKKSTAPDLLLSVPFYVYEDLAWRNATFGGRPVGDFARQDKIKFNQSFPYKHGDDYWFLEASLKHPMRTRNISEAKLFFVPWLLNYLDLEAEYDGFKLCLNNICDYDLLLVAQRGLRNSKAFRDYPERHVLVRSFFSSHWGGGIKFKKSTRATGNLWNYFIR